MRILGTLIAATSGAATVAGIPVGPARAAVIDGAAYLAVSRLSDRERLVTGGRH